MYLRFCRKLQRKMYGAGNLRAFEFLILITKMNVFRQVKSTAMPIFAKIPPIALLFQFKQFRSTWVFQACDNLFQKKHLCLQILTLKQGGALFQLIGHCPHARLDHLHRSYIPCFCLRKFSLPRMRTCKNQLVRLLPSMSSLSNHVIPTMRMGHRYAWWQNGDIRIL